MSNHVSYIVFVFSKYLKSFVLITVLQNCCLNGFIKINDNIVIINKKPVP